MRRSPISVAQASSRSYDYCAEGSMMIGQMLKKLVMHQASMKQLSGPVGIAVVAGKAAETKDWASKFGLAAAISLNLGILNLLPFPILDGGLILFLLIESIIRQDISMAIKERIYQAAFVLIVVFFAFVIFNDVSKLSMFSHVKP
jgi:regulator of sigma E protease